jgi:small neutral amino acid transporter SnatA (MarC family)
MIEWTFIIKTTIAMIAIVDPIGCLPTSKLNKST